MHFRHLTLSDGLSQNTVNTMLQDSQGFMWLGTESGLNRYNGYEIKRYHRSSDKHALVDDFIWDIAEDPSGDLWIATRNGGIARWSRTNDTFTSYRHDPDDPNSLASDSVRTLLISRQGKLWIGLRDGGLNVLDPQTGEFTHFGHDPSNKHSLASDTVFALYEDRAGVFWVGTDAGLNRFSPHNNSFIRFQRDPGDPTSLSSNLVRTIYEDAEGVLWVGTEDAGMNRMNRFTDRFVQLNHAPDDPNSLSDGHVRAILEDAEQRLWVATADGLNLLNRQALTFERFYSRNARDSLSDSYIMSLYQDRSGLIWVGTRSRGANIWNPRSWSFGHYLTDWLDQNNVTAFATDHDSLWIGTLNNGLTRLKNGQEAAYSGADMLADKRVMSLLLDKHRHLWIGTMNDGLYRLDLTADRLEAFAHNPDVNGGLPARGVMSLFEDRQGNIWIGSFGGGLLRYNPEDGSFTARSTDSGLLSPRVSAIAQDLDGYLWIGTDGGLQRLDPASDEMLSFNAQNSGLGSNSIYTLHVDVAGTLWIGTAGAGLIELQSLEGEQATFKHYGLAEGLPSNVVYGVHSDATRTLWFSTNNGLVRLHPQSGEIKRFHEAHGLQGLEFNFGAHHISSTGVMYFGGANGFNVVKPSFIQSNSTPPSAVLTEVRLMGEPAQLEQAYSEVDSLKLAHGINAITLEFAALDYTAPKKNLYSYRLTGFDQDWSKPSTRRSATYTNLEPGDYTFEVRVANSDGVWNDSAKSIRLILQPVPWLTWWAYSIYACLALAAIAMFMRAQMLRLRKKREHQAALHNLAYYDGLTGLPNRALFKQNLEQSVTLGREHAYGVALLYCGLNEFKRINDTLGERAGDKILQTISERMREFAAKVGGAYPRLSIQPARLGGDEFALTIRGLKEGQSIEPLARRFLEALTLIKAVNRYNVAVTPSLGVAQFPQDAESAADLMKNAHTALYEAKKSGAQSSLKLYSQEMNARSLDDLALEGQLRKALAGEAEADGQLYMVYQPKVSLEDGRIMGAEALIRWQHPEKGNIPPDRFIAIAERQGLIMDLDRWVASTVVHQMVQWRDSGLELLPIAINLSGAEFSNRDLAWSLWETVDDAQISPNLLEIEITEGVLAADTEAARNTVRRLRTMGFGVTIDDFGTGYSSLSYLKNFPVNTLKIDRSFVVDLVDNKEDQAIAGAIINMAASLDVKSVAEGIETEAQLQILKDFGCDIVQGYYLYKPLSQENFAAALVQQTRSAEKVAPEGPGEDSPNTVPLTLRYKSPGKV